MARGIKLPTGKNILQIYDFLCDTGIEKKWNDLELVGACILMIEAFQSLNPTIYAGLKADIDEALTITKKVLSERRPQTVQ